MSSTSVASLPLGALAEGTEVAFEAFHCDGMGDLVEHLDWTDPHANVPPRPHADLSVCLGF
jgi:hypothetical protein